MDLTQLLKLTTEKKASDLHIIAGYNPSIRVNDKLIQLKTHEQVTKDTAKTLLYKILNETQKEELETNKEIDFSYEMEKFRFRVNYYHSRGAVAAAFRVIVGQIPSIEQLNLPAAMHQFAKMNEGLVLLTGPTGEGKSTTIASILNEINLKENLKIDKEKLIEISKKNEGDIRGAINDLQSVTEGDLASRERKVDIFQVLKKVLKNRDDNILEILNDMDVTFEDYLLWMDENIPREYNHEELLKAYERLSRADVFRGRVMKWQYYRYLVYHMFLMSTGVSFAKKEPKIGFTSYQKPQRILKMFIAKQRYGKKRAISEKIAEKTHTSTKRVLDNFEDYIGILENKEVAKELELDDDEITWLKR